MPIRALRPCSYPGCRNLSRETRCPNHPYTRAPEPRKERTAARGYDAVWRRLRKWKLRQDPICQIRHHCHGAEATEVDHIVPIHQGGDRLDPDNLQSACKPCHSWKTNTIDKRNQPRRPPRRPPGRQR